MLLPTSANHNRNHNQSNLYSIMDRELQRRWM